MCTIVRTRHRHQHVLLRFIHFWDLTMLWVGQFKFIWFHFNCNIKGYKHLGLFCTKFYILLFITYVILLVNHGFFLFYSIFICKAVLSSPINAHLCSFSCIFRVLWHIPSFATGAPLPFHQWSRARVGACAHEEVNVALFDVFLP